MKETTLSDLADRYDVFLLDQFGVLLDGGGPYAQAPEALAALGEMGKQIAVISNSGKRAAPNEARLAAHGFDTGHIAAVISSGEATHSVLSQRIGKDLAKWAKVLVLARDGDVSCIEGLDITPIDMSSAADLVLIAGSRGDSLSLEHYRQLLQDPASRRVPAVCSNPDMAMLTGTGTAFGAGRIGALYRELGGPVDEIGKPHPLIYQVAAEQLGVSDPARVVCIGDSPAHDIRGGRGAGFKTALVRTGLHADEPLEALLARTPEGDQPDYVIPRFAM